MTAETTGLRLLIVEDDAMVAMLLEDMISDLGHKVTGVAAEMDEAAQLAASAAFDLAILDVNLNGENTYALADALTARGIPFVFATGYGISSLKPEWQNAPLLQKPFMMDDLERVLNDVGNRATA